MPRANHQQGCRTENKKELKDDYGLGRISPIGKEWYEQIEALENGWSAKPLPKSPA